MTALSIRRSFVTTAVLAVAFALLLVGLVLALPGPRAGAEHPPEYLAMGDSVSVGVGASDPATTGFVPLFRKTVGSLSSPGYSVASSGAQETTAYLKLSNVAVGGETSTSLIANGQLDGAVALLTERNQNSSDVDDVEVITLSIGGNDLTPLFATCPSVDPLVCFAQAQVALTTFGGNFGYILGQLRAAAGPETRIVVMTYYNPLQNPGCPISGLAGLGGLIVSQLNDAIVTVAGLVQNIEVADVAGAGIGADDLQPDCLHPDDSGYQKIADAFAGTYTGS